MLRIKCGECSTVESHTDPTYEQIKMLLTQCSVCVLLEQLSINLKETKEIMLRAANARD